MIWLLFRLGRFVVHRWTRYVAAWVAVLALAVHAQYQARRTFQSRDPDPQKRRRDGNDGHTSIDFGGQWMLGRMVATGRGRHLYDRRHLYEAVVEAYPRGDEAPDAPRHDADDLMAAFMDTQSDPNREWNDRYRRAVAVAPLMAPDAWQALALTAAREVNYPEEKFAEMQLKHVGGPLYPPTQALVFAPLAIGSAQRAYFIVQGVMLAAGFVAGLGVSALTRRRIWWPVATAMILLYPGFGGAHALGQNAPLSLAILVWGWVLMARGYDTAGGAVWGLFAFKPVWGAAFFLVILLTRRWRAGISMIAVGVLFAAATLPFVGLDSWFDWLKIGSLANRTYNVDGNWIPLSRDLLGLPRRLLIDTDGAGYLERDRWYAHVIGWSIWLFVVETTVRLSQLFPDRARAMTGSAAAFLLLAGWMACFHFMYYDSLLSALGFLVLLDPPRELFRPKLVTFQLPGGGPALDATAAEYFLPRLAEKHPGAAAQRTWVANSLVIYVGIALLMIHYTVPYFGLGATFTAGHRSPVEVSSAGEALVKDGKTVMHTRQIEIVSGTAGPAYETWLLLALWAWCAMRFVIDQPACRSMKAAGPHLFLREEGGPAVVRSD